MEHDVFDVNAEYYDITDPKISWEDEHRTFFVSASDLGWPPGRVDRRVTLFNSKTGSARNFVFDNSPNSLEFHYREEDGEAMWLVIFND